MIPTYDEKNMLGTSKCYKNENPRGNDSKFILGRAIVLVQ